VDIFVVDVSVAMRDTLAEARKMLPLGPSAFYILLALAEGESHGYGISRELELATGGAVRLGPGTLYRVIKQMVTDGWIEYVERDDPEEARRRYYRLTPWGRSIAVAEAERLSDIVDLARSRNLLGARS
jgi:DNA-binding PadR family transcriptional regulator